MPLVPIKNQCPKCIYIGTPINWALLAKNPKNPGPKGKCPQGVRKREAIRGGICCCMFGKLLYTCLKNTKFLKDPFVC